MTTARSIIELAAKQTGILGVGQTLLSEDTNDAFKLLQNMISQWQVRRWLVPSLSRHSFVGDGSESYSVGIGGDIDIPRPNDIKGAYVVQLNTGSNPVSLPLKKIFSYEDYIRITVKNLNSLPDHFFYDAQFPLANFYPWPLPSSQYRVHFLAESLLQFTPIIASGSIVTGGAAYVNAIYPNVPLTGGSGTGAAGDFTVTAGAVAIMTLNAPGANYQVGDLLSASAANLGGAGAGFSWRVDNLTYNIDSEILMPPEYEEAIFLNLSVRLSAMYQLDPMQTTIALAKKALNSIRVTNTQVPALTMPAAPGVRTDKAFNLYNADGY